jgi:hypothetical protein
VLAGVAVRHPRAACRSGENEVASLAAAGRTILLASAGAAFSKIYQLDIFKSIDTIISVMLYDVYISDAAKTS